MSPTGSVPQPRPSDIAQRRSRLADTLQSLLDEAHMPAEAPAEALPGAARRWAQSGNAGSDPADLAGEADAVCDMVSTWLLPEPLLATGRVNVALDRIHSAKTLDEVIRSAPAELGWAVDFDRVLLSRVEDSSWQPVSWHSNAVDRPQNRAMADLLRGTRIPLSNGMIEAEVIRRRLPALVRDSAAEGRTFAPFIEVGESGSYIVAPILTGDQVTGLLHADTDASGRSIGECDVTTVRAFADGLGVIFERIALLERLESQRASISDALAAAERAVSQLCDAPVTFSSCDDPPAIPQMTMREESRPESPIEARLTSREREVFSLLVAGATNAQIADRLTVSETTVKSHVKHILRKMRATNRSEAIAQYLRAGVPGVIR